MDVGLARYWMQHCLCSSFQFAVSVRSRQLALACSFASQLCRCWLASATIACVPSHFCVAICSVAVHAVSFHCSNRPTIKLGAKRDNGALALPPVIWRRYTAWYILLGAPAHNVTSIEGKCMQNPQTMVPFTFFNPY
jgi:hypothetical protein